MRKNIIDFCVLFIASYILWWILVAKFTVVNTILGFLIAIISSAFLAFVLKNFAVAPKLHFLFKKDFYKYLMFMVKEIVISVKNVLFYALSPKSSFNEDGIITIELPKNLSYVKIILLTFSITITPGTTIVFIDETKLIVHCLTKNIQNSIQERTFVDKILSFNF